tara:strand:- start:9743 stop:9850 length:108 start_codon:yes stop_codon:yes gene_type:complete
MKKIEKIGAIFSEPGEINQMVMKKLKINENINFLI